MKHLSSIFTLLIVAAPLPATTVIDFESIPEFGVPTGGLEISDQFFTTEGIIFSLEGGASPVIAQVGSPATGFFSGFGDDTPAPGQGIGSFFLTDNGDAAPGPIEPLIISYLDPTMAASGVILDIDGAGSPDIFIFEARDSQSNVLESFIIQAGDPGTGDGIATMWSFSRASADIFSIRISGNATGFGIDQFDPRNAAVAPIPEPSTSLLLGTGLVGLVYLRKKRTY